MTATAAACLSVTSIARTDGNSRRTRAAAIQGCWARRAAITSVSSARRGSPSSTVDRARISSRLTWTVGPTRTSRRAKRGDPITRRAHHRTPATAAARAQSVAKILATTRKRRNNRCPSAARRSPSQTAGEGLLTVTRRFDLRRVGKPRRARFQGTVVFSRASGPRAVAGRHVRVPFDASRLRGGTGGGKRGRAGTGGGERWTDGATAGGGGGGCTCCGDGGAGGGGGGERPATRSLGESRRAYRV